MENKNEDGCLVVFIKLVLSVVLVMGVTFLYFAGLAAFPILTIAISIVVLSILKGKNKK